MIGNSQTFGIRLLPVQPSWDTRYAPERAGWAGMEIWVNGNNLCRHVVSGESVIRDQVFVPLAPVVDWLVNSATRIAFEERTGPYPGSGKWHLDKVRWADTSPELGLSEDQWLDERDAWWQAHFLRAGSDGSLLPDLAVGRDDEMMVLQWDDGSHSVARFPLRFITPSGAARLPWNTGFEVLSEFARQVAASVSHVDELGYDWVSSKDPITAGPRDDAWALEMFVGQSLSRLRNLMDTDGDAAVYNALGLDPGWHDPAESVLCQVLRDLTPTISADLLSSVLDLGKDPRAGDTSVWRDLRARVHEAVRPAKSGIEAGYLAATEVRRHFSSDALPVGDLQTALLDPLNISVQDAGVPGRGNDMAVAASETSPPVIQLFKTPKNQSSWGRRFEQARALGHVLCDPVRHDRIGAGSGDFAQGIRRRRSGAFAAELLLPTSGIRAVLGDAPVEHAFPEILTTYGVGARTAAYQMWNHGFLASEERRDDLIDAYARSDAFR
ncbi:hypothetical protein ACOACO_16815 [Nocardioides sp. CPCC 205120]|uniref:hypothetical protein n=1 Tax=Nocardioides sp. CPCC 205120 TaxID=3406462 RepID=UPI003B5076E7